MDDITNYVIIGHNLIIRYNIIYAITIRYYWVVRIFKISVWQPSETQVHTKCMKSGQLIAAMATCGCGAIRERKPLSEFLSNIQCVASSKLEDCQHLPVNAIIRHTTLY